MTQRAQQIVDQLLEASAKDQIFDLANNGAWQRELTRDGWELENSESSYWVATKNVEFLDGPTVMVALTAPMERDTGSMMCEIGVWEWKPYKGGVPGGNVFFRRIHVDNAIPIARAVASRIQKYAYHPEEPLEFNVTDAITFKGHFHE